MMIRRNTLTRHLARHERGQILVIGAAVVMMVLIGITALAIDVGAALMTERWERSTADAAALAGAQDLQKPGSRAFPDSNDYDRAKSHAMEIVVNQLGATSTPTAASCYQTAGCAVPGTRYEVSIQTPSQSCVDCEKVRAIQVRIRQPSFGLTFGRIFGQNSWIVSSTSVAGVVHPRRYGIVVLRPPNPRSNGSDANEKDIDLTGGSLVKVITGDVGTNTNMNYSGGGAGSRLELDEGYSVFYYGAEQAWTLHDPEGVQITTLIDDPHYTIPTRTGATSVWTTMALAEDTAGCAAMQATVPSQYKNGGGVSVASMPASKVHCLKPGVYDFIPSNTNLEEVFLLEPGVFFFDRGLTNTRTLIGGWRGGSPGVALVFQEANTQNGSVPGQLQANNSELLALNFGDAYKNPTGAKATAAVGPQGLVQTSGPTPTLMSLMVVPDPNCPVANVEPGSCIGSKNKTLSLPGGGGLWVAGVQYAPTDNVVITGNSMTQGVVGQIVAYTLTFNSSFLNLEAAAAETNGVLRLDPACSPTLDAPPVCNQ